MSQYNIVAETAEYTVVSEYRPETRVGSGYQSEADLESSFISLLRTQGYEYLPLHDEAALITNLRKQPSPTASGAVSFRSASQTATRASRKRPGRYRKTTCRSCAGTTVPRRTSGFWTKRTSTTTACRSSTSMKNQEGLTGPGMT